MNTSEAGLGSAAASADVHNGLLYQRTVTAFRKFWPQVQLSTTWAVFPSGSSVCYDFNGNATFDSTLEMTLEGHQCLVFFLGGIQTLTTDTSSGQSKDRRHVGFRQEPAKPVLEQPGRRADVQRQPQRPLHGVRRQPPPARRQERLARRARLRRPLQHPRPELLRLLQHQQRHGLRPQRRELRRPDAPTHRADATRSARSG